MKIPRGNRTKVTGSRALAAGSHRGTSDDKLKRELAECRRQLKEALEQQTATSDILRVITSPSTAPQLVFDTIVRNAKRLCSARFGALYRFDGERLHLTAHDVTPEVLKVLQRAFPMRPSRSQASGRAILSRDVSEIRDVHEDPEYLHDMARAGDWRSLLAVPMLHADGTPMGTIVVHRSEPGPFAATHIEMLKTFAAQAVIAIENARLLKELRERTEQLEVRSQEIAKLNQQLEQRVADQVGEIERMGRLRRFLPPQVADLIVASGSERQLESHRREITALFCDLRGFSESSDPEDVMTLLRQYHEVIGKIITNYSGTLERYAGDGVMVVFNDPLPVDNPALQAVRMALDMRTELMVLIERWRRLGHQLGFGIGIAHGYATLGTIGFEGRFDYAAIGTVANVASRLCDEAKPGQILISPRVLMAVEDTVSVEPAGDFALKGISRPLAAHNVIARNDLPKDSGGRPSDDMAK
jgi:class 3 adenylate cyclase